MGTADVVRAMDSGKWSLLEARPEVDQIVHRAGPEGVQRRRSRELPDDYLARSARPRLVEVGS